MPTQQVSTLRTSVRPAPPFIPTVLPELFADYSNQSLVKLAPMYGDIKANTGDAVLPNFSDEAN